jgi:hypothetical protein
LFAGSVVTASAQSVVSSGGGLVLAPGLCLSFTVGEAVVDGGAGDGTLLTAGYEQPSSYDYWSASRGLTLGPMGDSDGDGAKNLWEYASSTDPLNARSRAKAQGNIGPGGKLYITAAKGTSVGDLLWSAEVSTNLVNWSPSGVGVALNDATTFSALYTGSAPYAFLRLRLDLLNGK